MGIYTDRGRHTRALDLILYHQFWLCIGRLNDDVWPDEIAPPVEDPTVDFPDIDASIPTDIGFKRATATYTVAPDPFGSITFNNQTWGASADPDAHYLYFLFEIEPNEFLANGPFNLIESYRRLSIMTDVIVPVTGSGTELRLGNLGAQTWTPTTTLPFGYFILPTVPNGHIYQVVQAGETASVEPVWLIESQQFVSNGTVLFQEYSTDESAVQIEAAGNIFFTSNIVKETRLVGSNERHVIEIVLLA